MSIAAQYTITTVEADISTQKNNTKLSQLNSQLQSDSVQVQSEQAQDNAKQDILQGEGQAQKDTNQAIDQFVQAGMSGLQVLTSGGSLIAGSMSNSTLTKPMNFQQKASNIKPATAGFTDKEIANLSSEQQERYTQLAEGRGPFEWKEGDEDIVSLVKANKTAAKTMQDRNQEEINNAHSNLSRQSERRQNLKGLLDQLGQTVQHGLSGQYSGMENAKVDTTLGAVQAHKTLAQNLANLLSELVRHFADTSKQERDNSSQIAQGALAKALEVAA